MALEVEVGRVEDGSWLRARLLRGPKTLGMLMLP
jgi:hypothetical protein